MRAIQVILTASAFLCLALWVALAQERANPIARLADERLDPAVLAAIEAQPIDPTTMAGLEAAFQHRSVKSEKQAIASTLIRLGSKSDKYFEFLASFARMAVEDRTPYFQLSRGRLSPEFETWCAQNRKDPKSVVAIQASVYPEDLRFLVKTEDVRAIGLYRKGLESPNPMVVAISAEGLARLHDGSSIPLIENAATRLPIAKRAIAMALPWYGTSDAYSLMERLEPDRKSRDFHVDQVERQRSLENSRALKRNRAPDHK